MHAAWCGFAQKVSLAIEDEWPYNTPVAPRVGA